MAGMRPFGSARGGHHEVGYAPLAATQTYDHGDPVFLVANKLTETTKDASVVLNAELIGFAAEPAEGYLAASRSTNMTIVNPAEGGGTAQESMRKYYKLVPGQLFHTVNFWTAITGTTQDTIAGGDLGTVFQIASAVAGNWGLVDAAATVTSDVAARVIQVLDAAGRPFTGATGETTAGTLATQIIFEIANIHELTQVMGG